MPYTSLFAQEEEERPTTGAGYTSVFGGGAKDKDWASMTPEERLRAFQERYPGAMPGLNEKMLQGPEKPVHGQDAAQEVGEALSGFVTLPSGRGGVREGLGRIAESVAGLADLPSLIGSVLAGPPPEAYIGAQIAGNPITPEREARMRAGGAAAVQALVPGFIERPREAIRANYQQIREEEVEEGVEAGKSPVRIATEDTVKEAVAMVLDPLNWVGAGGAAKAGRAVAREGGEVAAKGAARKVAGGTDEALGELAQASQAIGASQPSVRRVARVVDSTQEGAGAVRSLAALDEAGDTVGQMTFSVEPDGGFRVMDVETGGRGTGGMRAMMQEAREASGGPYLGSMAETDEGAAALARLRETDPDLFELGVGEGLPSSLPERRPSEAGFLKVGKEPRKYKDPTQPKPPATSRLARWFSSEGDFEAAGNLRSTFAELRASATGETKAELWRASRNWAKVERQLPKAKDARAQVEAQVVEYLEAPEAQRLSLAAQLPEGLVEPLEKMRAHMADLQLRAINTPGLLSDEMAEIYGSNIGRHLTRGYEAFINPKYLDEVHGTKVWDEVFDEWRADPGRAKMTDAEIEGAMEDFVRRGPQMFRPVSRGEVVGKKGALGAQRKDLSDAEQRLLGRIDDPEYRYKRTVERLAPDIAEQTMLNEMYELGKDSLFFDKRIAGFSQEIPGVSAKDPLGGKFTTPEMAEVIGGFRGIQSREPNLVNWFVDQYLRANGFVKTGFTAYSPTTHVRNSGSWGLLGLATGHGIAPVRRSLQAIRALRETGDTRKLLSSIGIKSPQRFDALWEESLRLGVTGQSVNVGHLEDYARWVKQARKERGRGAGASPLAKPFDVTSRFAETAYALEDDLPKFALWLEETKLYRKALPNASDTEVMRTAARNIRNITPTWDKVPRGIREVSRFPFFGMFPGFQAEMVRNTKNLLKLSVQEIRSGNPQLRKVGLRRLAGLQASLAIPEAIAVAGGAALTGATMGEQTETIMRRREFQPEWQRNSSMLYWDAEGEDFRQLDVGFLDPRAGMKKPILAVVAGILQEEAGVPRSLGRGAAQFGEAFLGTEAGVRTIAQAAQNRDEMGRTISNPEDPAWKQALRRAAHVGKAVSPGVVRGNINIAKSLRGDRWATGKQRKPWQEVLATYGGTRISDTNVAQSAPYYAWGLGERRQAVRRMFSEAIRSDLRSDEAKVRPGTASRASAEAQEAWEQVYADAARLLDAVKGEGIPQAEAFLDALDNEGGWREEELLALVKGDPAPPVILPEDFERVLKGQEELYRFSPELQGGTP